MTISVQLFAAPVTPQLVIAVILATSTLQYNLPSDALASSDEKSSLLSCAAPPRRPSAPKRHEPREWGRTTRLRDCAGGRVTCPSRLRSVGVGLPHLPVHRVRQGGGAR